MKKSKENDLYLYVIRFLTYMIISSMSFKDNIYYFVEREIVVKCTQNRGSEACFPRKFLKFTISETVSGEWLPRPHTNKFYHTRQ